MFYMVCVYARLNLWGQAVVVCASYSSIFILILSWIYVKVASLFLHYSGYFRMHRHPVSYVLTHIHTS